MSELPAHESEPVVAARDVVAGWIQDHPASGASMYVDRSAYDAGRGHVLLVVTTWGELARDRDQIVSLVGRPDRVRVRPSRPSPEQLDELLQLILATRMGPAEAGTTVVTSAGVDRRAGVVRVSLNRHDDPYAAELVELGGGLVEVDARPAVVTAVPPAEVYSPLPAGSPDPDAG